ncbi:MAG: apolipoprotein N-acyltransferase [Gammaproteobacteria bacterium]
MSRAVLAVLAGALLPLSMAPFDLWPLGVLSIGLWFHLLTTGKSRGLLTGWCYGLGAYGLGVSWVYVSIHEHGGAPPLLAGLLVAIFVGGMALFPMANGWLFGRARSGERLADACWFVVLLIGFEWLLTWFLTGFPWIAVGYGQIDSWLAGFAPLGGVRLVSFMTAASAVAAALFIDETARERRLSVRPALLGVALVPWLGGFALDQVSWTAPLETRTAALVQGNIPQETKWQPDNRVPIVRHYMALSEPYWGADLILWPEAAITVFEHQAGDLLATLDTRGKSEGTGLVLGLPAVEATDGDYAFLNTAVGLGEASGRYVKRRLVPFGEYVPLEGLLRGLIQFFDLPMSHSVSGAANQPPLEVGGDTAVMAICYEIVYPELVRSDVDVLLTISNDTWFGDSIGPKQHLAIARMRALENGRWLLRATNNGITAIVDASGEVRARLPQFEPGVLRGEYRIMAGRTPFNRLGPWPLYALLVAAAVWLILRKRSD